MMTKLLIVAALVGAAAPALGSTQISDPFGAFSNDQTTRSAPVPETDNKDSYMSPFGDHLRQSQTDDATGPTDSRSRNNLTPPRVDASGVPDPRI